jgi:general secretion pathway protein E
MGIEPYLISSSVVAVMAQRLLRVICPECKTPYILDEQTASQLQEKERASIIGGQLYKGFGCKKCLDTGYLGRTGISELLVIDEDIKELVSQRCGSHIIKETAIRKGMSTLRSDGFRKALAGETTLEEVYRVTQDYVQTNVRKNGHADS